MCNILRFILKWFKVHLPEMAEIKLHHTNSFIKISTTYSQRLYKLCMTLKLSTAYEIM